LRRDWSLRLQIRPERRACRETAEAARCYPVALRVEWALLDSNQ
jgi:hypothetical protein